MSHEHRLTPGKKVRFDSLSTKGKDFCDNRLEAEAEFGLLRQELAKLQEKFYAEGQRKLLILFQAMDTGGKDGTIREVFSGVNPQGISVTSFKSPTPEELAHDFLWRIHKAVPGNGMLGVFNRSHYEDVLIVRVDKLVPEAIWKARYEQLNQFEKLLTDTGTTILKFFLHISEAEQKERLQERQTEKRKQWKFSVEDVAKRQEWPKYMQAYDDLLERCTTPYAPWHVIPADQKWYRNLAVTRVIVQTLKDLDPKFPDPPTNIRDIVIK